MSRTRPSRLVRRAGVAAALGASLILTGCGFDAQTLRTYTPAHGVNVDVNDIKVRNLLVIANSAGQGRLSASIVSPRADTLANVTGYATNQDGSQAAPLTITGATGLPLPPNKLVVLTGEGAPLVSVTSPALKPGLNVTLQLTFGSGGAKELRVPVMDAQDPIYRTAAPELSR
nr:hypothetical protein [Propionibacterium sp.]